MLFQLKNICCLLLPSLIHHKECKFFKYTIIPLLVGWSKCRFSNRISPHSKMITLLWCASSTTTTSRKLSRLLSWPNISARSWLQHVNDLTYQLPLYLSTKWRNLSLSRNSTNCAKAYLFLFICCLSYSLQSSKFKSSHHKNAYKRLYFSYFKDQFPILTGQ